MPRFSGDNRLRAASFDWCAENRTDLAEKRTAAAQAMFEKHEAEQNQPGLARPPKGREAW
jgi:hypothetical protein